MLYAESGTICTATAQDNRDGTVSVMYSFNAQTWIGPPVPDTPSKAIKWVENL